MTEPPNTDSYPIQTAVDHNSSMEAGPANASGERAAKMAVRPETPLGTRESEDDMLDPRQGGELLTGTPLTGRAGELMVQGDAGKERAPDAAVAANEAGSPPGQNERPVPKKRVRFAEELEHSMPPDSRSPSPDYSDWDHDDDDEPCRPVQGCTLGSGSTAAPQDKWRMSCSMIAAYNAMQGGGTIADSDLVAWEERGRDAGAEGGGLIHKHMQHVYALMLVL